MLLHLLNTHLQKKYLLEAENIELSNILPIYRKSVQSQLSGKTRNPSARGFIVLSRVQGESDWSGPNQFSITLPNIACNKRNLPCYSKRLGSIKCMKKVGRYIDSLEFLVHYCLSLSYGFRDSTFLSRQLVSDSMLSYFTYLGLSLSD